jgi:RNA polymerase sigma-70 factor (ECF subfamily)
VPTKLRADVSIEPLPAVCVEVKSGLTNENELIRRAQSGDTASFCQLAEAYERRIYSLAFHYCRERQDAEDLSQEAWLKAYAALASYRHESTFYTWLRKITINCFLNHQRSSFFRSQKQSSELADATTSDADHHPAAEFESTLQNRLVVEKVMQALADVTPKQRLMFLLKHHEGMTYEEIAKEFDCSLGTVKKSVSRTIAKLRDKLGVNDEPGDYISCAATQSLR